MLLNTSPIDYRRENPTVDYVLANTWRRTLLTGYRIMRRRGIAPQFARWIIVMSVTAGAGKVERNVRSH